MFIKFNDKENYMIDSKSVCAAYLDFEKIDCGSFFSPKVEITYQILIELKNGNCHTLNYASLSLRDLDYFNLDAKLNEMP